MSIIKKFDLARAEDMGVLPCISNDPPEYLVVTCQDLFNVNDMAKIDRSRVYIQMLTPIDDADEVLNSVARWMKQQDTMNQRADFGENRATYNFGFYWISEAPCYASRRGDFQLKEYLFPDRRLEDAHDLDSFMRMIDRDRLAEDMRRTLVEDFDLPLREDAPLFWRRDMRQASHPDWRSIQAPAHVLAA